MAVQMAVIYISSKKLETMIQKNTNPKTMFFSWVFYVFLYLPFHVVEKKYLIFANFAEFNIVHGYQKSMIYSPVHIYMLFS